MRATPLPLTPNMNQLSFKTGKWKYKKKHFKISKPETMQ